MRLYVVRKEFNLSISSQPFDSFDYVYIDFSSVIEKVKKENQHVTMNLHIKDPSIASKEVQGKVIDDATPIRSL